MQKKKNIVAACNAIHAIVRCIHFSYSESIEYIPSSSLHTG